ncbi:hypothetical protein [Vulcanisaeta souniana]|uniref:hypothetical protein n=1 Tax=Vulcanisaeta souniana TaxID=164452 RepID=UPI0006D02B3A|nr:hypothetical protein [Vulcanisaeta souniana]
MGVDEERERIRIKIMMELMSKAQQKASTRQDLTRDDVIRLIRQITRGGDRAEEIINNALQLYGDTAVQVFRQLVELHLSGRLSELQDYELYQVLERVGLHVPIRTRIRIVRHGKEENIGSSDE